MKNHTIPLDGVLSRLLLALTAFAASAGAQDGSTRPVSGRVINAVTNDYVRNAEVRLEGTAFATATEHDGSFQFKCG